MPALGTSANTVLERTEQDLNTGLFWFYSPSMRETAQHVIQRLTEDKFYPLTVARATHVIQAITTHELSVSMLASGDQVTFLYMTIDQKAKKGDHAVVKYAQEGSELVDVALDGDPSTVFAVSRVLLFVGPSVYEYDFAQ
jgi:hypothetical protein